MGSEGKGREKADVDVQDWRWDKAWQEAMVAGVQSHPRCATLTFGLEPKVEEA